MPGSRALLNIEKPDHPCYIRRALKKLIDEDVPPLSPARLLTRLL